MPILFTLLCHFNSMSINTTKHVVHHGVNCGNNTWTIDNKKLIHRILNAKVGELFESKPFKMAQLLWTIRLYPNGNNNNSKGSVKIFLKLVSMPHTLSQIILSYTTCDPLSMSTSTAMDIYLKNGDSKGWLNRSLILKEWKQCNNLSIIQIVVSVNIIKIKLKKHALYLSHYRFNQQLPSPYPTKQRLIYQIDTYTLSKFKQSYYGKRYESVIFNNMWKIRWFPVKYLIISSFVCYELIYRMVLIMNALDLFPSTWFYAICLQKFINSQPNTGELIICFRE